MIAITRKLEFDAGHRILGHEGKCRFLHGHRYSAEITVEAHELDSVGRVIDFGIIKTIVGKWIDENWDHNLLLNSKDPQRYHLETTEERLPYIMSCNPTAENIARELFKMAVLLLPSHLQVVQVRIWETPNCYADYRGKDDCN